MIIGETVAVALRALAANTLRSVLTMLGIVIGVAAVIAMLALGTGARLAIQARIASLGTTRLTVNPTRVVRGGVETSDIHRITMQDVEFLKHRSRLITAIQPQQDRDLQVEYHGTNTYVQVTGATPNFLEVQNYHIAIGRMFTDDDGRGRRRVAVIGSTVLHDLGFEHAGDAVGKEIRIRGVGFTVIGVLASKGEAAGGFFDPDDQVLIPFNTGRFIVFDTPYLNDIHVLAPNEAAIPQTMSELQRIMRRAHRLPAGAADDFRIRSQMDFLSALSDTTKIFSLLLAAIASVSLLVGGVGIMNIMLVSVTERTREIGLRQAVGAKTNDILIQFLVEAVTLSLLGGVIGILLGILASKLISIFAQWSTLVSPGSILLAFVFSALVGVFFGFYPARKAALLDPIDALRYE
ncbi:MAG TPA: ABC transporter permease [Gemmatimonadaceae bacterium]|nr:ABC transporter permease [Gemmatimonadaceae bacterium]